jgi:flagellar assembly protein FliH
MASRSDIKAGRAYVELYLKNSELMKGLKQIREDFQKVGSLTMALGRNMMAVGVGIGGAFGAVALALKGPIEAAGYLMETTSKFQSVFGDATEEMLAFAATYSKTVGRAKSDTMSSLATMQSFFLGMGLDPAKAAEFAKQMATASVDFASFHNLSDAEGMERFISALSGSGEVLSMFGVNIMQAALDQQLLSMGFKKSTQGATEMEKVLARIAIIQQTMSKQGATDDATRTAGSFSNQMKKLQGEIKNASEAIGNALLPVVREALGMLASDSKAAVVRLNPVDLEVVSNVLQSEFPGLALQVLGDAAVQPGGCVVESAGTVVDGTLERRWQRAVASLGLESDWKADHGEH